MNALLTQAGFALCDTVPLLQDLPRRWAGQGDFTVLEIGGASQFEAIAQTWRDDPQRSQRLHGVSLHAGGGGLKGVHRQLQSDPRITHTTAVGDVTALLPQLRLGADAIWLDAALSGWDVRLLRHCARLCRPGAQLYTHDLTAQPRWHAAPLAAPWPETQKHALVIGAGIAGASVADRLAARGWQVTVLDAADAPARGASGLWLGALHPHFSQDDCLLSRASRAAMVLAVQRFNQLRAQSPHSGWNPCGVAHPATHAEEEAGLRQLCEQLQLPETVVRFLERDALSAQAGAELPLGGYWHAQTGVVDVRQLVDLMLAQPAVRWQPRSRVHRIERTSGHWQALDAQGQPLAQAPVMVLANAGDAPRLAPQLASLLPVRGQMTALAAAAVQAPQAAVVGHGYVLPAHLGRVSVGATYAPGSTDPAPTQADHETNLQSLAVLLPQHPAVGVGQVTDSFVGTRYASNDHMPLVGPVPDVSDTRWLATAAGKRLTDWPRLEGLYCAAGYGSRGLSWSVLAGEIIASHLCGEPAPLEAALMDALDPARFGQRAVRKGL